MSKRELTQGQKNRMNDIFEKWAEEKAERAKSIVDDGVKRFDGPLTSLNRELELKYMPEIRKILSEK